MKTKKMQLLFLLVYMLVLSSCFKNDFEVISNYNLLLKNEQISKLDITNKYIKTYYYYDNNYKSNNTEDFQKRLFSEKLRGINSKIIILNKSNQIIEVSYLTVLIKFTFENDKIFNYIRPHVVPLNNGIWDKNQTIELNLNDVIKFSNSKETKIFNIHKPLNIIIEYYITAANALDYSNIEGFSECNNFYSFANEDIGWFQPGSLQKDNMYCFGEKILSEDITAIWHENTIEVNSNHKNGDLNDTFLDKDSLNKEKEYTIEKERLIADGWKDGEIQNGQFSACYNFKPSSGKINNYLNVTVGGGTDVSIKIMNLETNNCVRYVYINSGTNYKINNIPEGKYYLKIAYGKDWLSKIENNQCIGKFIRNPLYEKGTDILNFNIQKNSEGSSIPSYELSLDVIASDISNSFNSQKITETDFNK